MDQHALTQRAWYGGTGVVVGGVAVVFFVLMDLVPIAVLMAVGAVVAMVEVTRAMYRLERSEPKRSRA